MSSFAARLKDALVGDAHARFVYLGNFEVEHQWSLGEVGLPGFGAASAVVNRMDELALLLAQATDVVVLKEPPDQSYLDYLRSLGLELPTIVAAGRSDPATSVTEDALADESILNRVAEAAGFY